MKGLLSGEVEIASQGLQGSWTIEVKFGDSITTKGFTVAEYGTRLVTMVNVH